MSKLNKQFKERIKSNKSKGAIKQMLICHDTEVNLGDKIVLIKIDNVFARTDEIEEQVKDLFRVKSNFKQGEKIELSKIVDVDFDISYLGIEKSKPTFKLC